MPAASVRVLDWDTRFFGRRIGRLDAGDPSSRGFSEALAAARAQGVEGLYWLASATDPEAPALAAQGGFRLTDIRIVLEASPPSAPGPAPGTLRPARNEDLDALRAIARESHRDSRFYHDPGIPRDRCDALYETWIERSCAGWADGVWVADDAGDVAGYVTLHRDGPAQARIGLLAVGSRARGRGVGVSLVRQALREAAAWGAGTLSVATQARNVPAQRLYQRCGFLTSSVGLWYHRWFDPSEAPG